MGARTRLVPISDLRHKQSQVLDALADGPVILVQRSKAAAVMVDLETWNAMAEAVDDLEDTVIALKAELRIARGGDELEPWDPAELGDDREMAADVDVEVEGVPR